ncbi:MAG TPA: hypothetical protein VEM32_06645 [Geobacteraceae bacterium]|nr:hypothetical protein [Geobacteraceae bacterium]
MRQMVQVAPYPEELETVLSGLDFRFPGWAFELRDMPKHAGARGLTLVITHETTDAYNPGKPYTVTHPMSVPPASHDERNWARWVLEMILLVQRHEAMEAFVVNGRRPFPPGHGGGHDPYYPITIY